MTVGGGDAGAAGFFLCGRAVSALSAAGDPLERLAAVVDFEVFRADLDAALTRSDRAKGGRPPYDAVLMFKVLVLQVLYGLSDDQAEFQVLDRRSFGRFLGLYTATGCRMRRRSGCSCSGSPVPVRSSGFSTASIGSSTTAAISLWGGRSSMPLSSRRAGRGSPPPRRRRSRARYTCSLVEGEAGADGPDGRWTLKRAARSRSPMVRRGQPRSSSRRSATRTTSASTAASA